MQLKKYIDGKFKGLTFLLSTFTVCLYFFIPFTLHSKDTGFKFFKNYTYKDYDHQAQNWGVIQSKSGIIYIANHAGVLEFDGVSWRVIKVPGYDTARSIAIDETGTIYVGGKDKIGYLDPDSKGTLKYQSLLGKVKDEHKNFSNVWNTHATKDGIYFRTTKFLFRWNGKKIKVWETGSSFRASFVCNGDFFVQKIKVGLMKVVGDSLILMPGSETFSQTRNYMLVPYNKNNKNFMLIGTRTKGFFLYDGKAAKPFPTKRVDNYLKENNFYHGIRLSSGDFALATLNGGLVIMDAKGHRKSIFDKAYGLQDDQVYYVFEDIQENLWLCLSKGITRIENGSPISIFDERSNLSGLVLSVVKHDNRLYAGTTDGLYYLESPLKFHIISHISGSCWSLASIGDSLLAATSEGVFPVKINETGENRIIEGPSYVLLPSKHYSGRVWCGTSNGVVVLAQEDGKWKEEQPIETINRPVQFIAEEKNGDLWLITTTFDVLKVTSPVNSRQPAVTVYDFSHGRHGLPEGEVYLAPAAGKILFFTIQGIYRFDEGKKEFVPDNTLGVEFAGGEKAKPVFRFAEDKNKNIWFHSESRNYRAVPGPQSFHTQYKPFLRFPTAQVNTIYPAPDGEVIWFGSYDGLIRYDMTVKKNYQQSFKTLIRKIVVDKELIFEGSKNKTGEIFNKELPFPEYKKRNFRFEFAAPFFEDETRTEYRSFLEGYEEDWSDWNKDTKRDFTNLDSGVYTFRVQARNVYQHPGAEDVFRFKVLPPWYKTWWAFLFYVALFFLLIVLAVKWRSGKLEQEKQKLELIIKERTKEINDKNQQLEKQTHKLRDQSEKLKEMDKVKSRFFANISHEFRTPLTLIKGPLEQMLSDSSDQKQKSKIKLMLRNSQRVLTLINQLLDLSRFDSGQMKLQAAHQDIVLFLKGITASFELVARQNKLELTFFCDTENVFLYFDAPKMEDAMNNLLINAVKFTPPGGEITVYVSTGKPDFLEISVRDTGIGIAKEQFAHIFDRFYQAESPGQNSNKGTGIGLALTRETVLLHHGKIDVHSREGKGTEFVIRLPMGREHLKSNEIVTTPGIESDQKKNKEIETLYITAEEEAERNGDEGFDMETDEACEEKTEAQEKDVILVVEDNSDVRKYIRESLEPLYTVVEACDGKEGTAQAKEIIPDLIVSDIMMPEIDGNELCRQLKKDVKTSHIPIILLTAKASEESIIQGLETGADDYITKPFNTKILLTRIKNLIELRRQLQLKIQRHKMLLPAEISVSSVDDKFLKEFQDIIDKNLSDPEFHVEQLSEKLYMNRVTLFRKIRALTGESPTEFIRSYRLQRAAQLLRDNFGNVSEVALAVGFSNLGYFSRCFKEKFHQLPSDYKAAES